MTRQVSEGGDRSQRPCTAGAVNSQQTCGLCGKFATWRLGRLAGRHGPGTVAINYTVEGNRGAVIGKVSARVVKHMDYSIMIFCELRLSDAKAITSSLSHEHAGVGLNSGKAARAVTVVWV